jgi:ferredoxin
MASLAMRSRFAAKTSPVRAAKPAARQVSVKAFKVTLKTPSGDKTIEVAPDTYILDAAEVSEPSATSRSGSLSVGAS